MKRTSASPKRSAVSNRAAVADVLRAFAGAMDAAGLRWYLFGAQAANIWGSRRFSEDVDLTVQTDVADADRLIRTLGEHGFDLTQNDARDRRLLQFLRRSTKVSLDVIIGGPGLDEEFAERAIRVDVEGTSVPVIAPDDLVVMKILAGRPKDLEDLRAVVDRHRATLDVARIRSLLSLLEQALTRGDLLPVFESVWNR